MPKLGDVFAAAVRPMPSGQLLPAQHDVFGRWNAQKSTDSKATVRRLDRIWKYWTFGRKERFLLAIEAIAAAEASRDTVLSRSARRERLRLAKSAVLAVRMVNELAPLLAMGDRGSYSAIARLVAYLNAFVRDAVFATSSTPTTVARAKAQALMRPFRRTSASTRAAVPSSLVAELVTMVGKGSTADVRRVRHYMSEHALERRRSPTDAHWRRNWALVLRAMRLLPDRSGTFEPEMLEFLTATAQVTSRKKTRATRSATPPARSADLLQQARKLRDSLKVSFQEAEPQGEVIYTARLRFAVNEAMPDMPPERVNALLAEIVRTGVRPSRAASRIAARAFKLPLRMVRAGAATSGPRRTGRGRVSGVSIEMAQDLEEAEKRGRRRHRRR